MSAPKKGKTPDTAEVDASKKKKSATSRKKAPSKDSAATATDSHKESVAVVPSESGTKPAKKKHKVESERPKKTKKSSNKTPSPRTPSTWQTIGRFALSICVGAICALVCIGYASYRAALYDIQQWTAPSVATEDSIPGRIWSRPLELRLHLKISQKEVEDLLLAAGYSKVDSVERPMDFVVKNDSIQIAVEGKSKTTQPINSSSSQHIEVFFANSVTTPMIIDIVEASKKRRESVQLAPVLLASYSHDNSAAIRNPLDKIPKHVPQAILAMEDSRFYQHEGVDFLGLSRALIVNLVSDSKSQGASTITQQLVKNLILQNPEKTYKRKAKEAIRAIALEHEFSKKELLEMYVNEVYLGQVNGRAVVGVSQAAKVYFGKSVDRLSIGEAAMIAGIISAPNSYSPMRHPEKAKERRDITLKRMLTTQDISQEEYDKELAKPLELNIRPEQRRANYFVDGVVDKIENHLGDGLISALGLQIYSTVDPITQLLAEKTVQAQVEALEKQYPQMQGAQVAMVVLSHKTGEVLAMVGGRNYGKSQFNRAVYAKRQVGSLVKPLLYGLLFDSDSSLSPGCWVEDKEIAIVRDGKEWKPTNYDHQYMGYMTLRNSLALSRNTPSVQIYQRLQEYNQNPEFFVEFGTKIGLTGIGSNPSASLGAFEASVLDMAEVYASIANHGIYQEAKWTSAIAHRSGEQLENIAQDKHSVLGANSAWLVQSMLEEVVQTGTAKKAVSFGALGALAAKTGTTNNGHDAWVVGFDPEVVVAVWVGFDKGTSLGLGGSQAALPIWASYFANIDTKRESTFSVPKSVESATVCANWDNCETEQREDWFVKGTYADSKCALFEFEDPSFVARLFPTISKQIEKNPESIETTKKEEDKEEGLLFRLLPWGKKK